jgi:GAF domain-containing protein
MLRWRQLMSQSDYPLSLLSILPETPEEKILHLLIELGVQMVVADEGSILVLDEDTQELVFAMTAGNPESEMHLRGQRMPMDKGIAGMAAVTREAQTGAPVFSKIDQWPGRTPVREPAAVLAAPMLIADNVVGVITAVRFSGEARFKGKEVELYSRFASLAGAFVEMRRRLVRLEVSRVPVGNEASSERQALEDRIIASVRHLVLARPDSLKSVAAMLQAVADLVSPH